MEGVMQWAMLYVLGAGSVAVLFVPILFAVVWPAALLFGALSGSGDDADGD